MKISSYPEDKEAHEQWQALIAEGKAVVVILNGVALNPGQVFGADEEAGTVDVAVLGEGGQLQRDPKYPDQIVIDHDRRKRHNDKLILAGKDKLGPGAMAPKSRKHKVVPGRILTRRVKGVVKIIVTDPVPAPEAKA